jgi:hypothetical protein
MHGLTHDIRETEGCDHKNVLVPCLAPDIGRIFLSIALYLKSYVTPFRAVVGWRAISARATSA